MSLSYSSATPTPAAPKSKHGHDLSMTRQFTCMPGQLLPVFKTILSPGDKVKLNSTTFIRTEAVESAAFVFLTHHAEWFAVPITQLYRFWNEFFNGTNDYMSSFCYSGSNGITRTDVNFKLPLLEIFSRVNSPFANTFYFTSASGKYNAVVDDFGIPKIWNFARLVDLLGYGAVSTNTYLNTLPSTLPADNLAADFWHPFYFLAYHKIYHSHYMNTDYFENKPYLYNFDKYYSGTPIPNFVNDSILSTIHYRPYSPDFFTQQQPSPVFDNRFANFISGNPLFPNSSNNLSGSKITQDNIAGVNLNIALADPDYTSPTPKVIDSLPVSNYQDNVSAGSPIITTGNLRALFALEKLSRITASTGSHYYDQTLAHFGYKMPRGISDEAIYIGSQSTPIEINEVVATATTLQDSSRAGESSGSLLGDIAGKGFSKSSQSNDLDFEAPCDCVLMCISSVEVKPFYASIRSDIDNRYSHSYDFFHPEFDNLGLQPFFNSVAFENSTNISTSDSIGLGTIGWQRRWAELKNKYDVVNESMFATSKNIWVGYKQAPYEDYFKSTKSVPLEFIFYTCPQYLNNIFLSKVPYYDSTNPLSITVDSSVPGWSTLELTPNYMYASDNFLINMHIKCFKSSIMSPTSLPKLGL